MKNMTEKYNTEGSTNFCKKDVINVLTGKDSICQPKPLILNKYKGYYSKMCQNSLRAEYSFTIIFNFLEGKY